MLLEMLPTVPEFAADVLTWRPLSYQEYFALALQGARAGDRGLRGGRTLRPPEARRAADSMNTILWATTAALQRNLSPEAAGSLARRRTWLKRW